MASYLIKEDPSIGRTVYRIDDEDETSYTVSVPLASCFGCVFRGFGRQRKITKKWLNQRGFSKMAAEMSLKYDNIERGDPTSTLFD